MRLSHSAAKTSARFDDPNLVSHAGLSPLMRLAERCDLAGLVDAHVQTLEPAAANAQLKVAAIVAGMAAGADSIDDLDLLRHGGMPRLFAGVRAPSTLGSFLPLFALGQRAPPGRGQPADAGRAVGPGAGAGRGRVGGVSGH